MKKILFLFTLITFSSNAQITPGYKISTNSYSNINTSYLEDVDDNGDKMFYTLNWRGLVKVREEIKDLEEAIEEIKTSTDFSTIVSLSRTDLERVKEEIDSIQKIIDKKTEDRKYYYRQYMQEFVQIEKNHWLPGQNTSRAIFDVVYGNSEGKLTTLSTTGFTLGDETGTLYSELVSDQLWAFRVSLGASLTSTSSDDEDAKQQEAFQRLLAQGGNTTLKIEYPLLYLHNKSNSVNFLSKFTMRGSADFEQFGSNTEDWAGNAAIGIDLFFDFATENNKIRFFVNGEMNNIWGTKTFNENLGVENKSFTFGQASVGLIYDNLISFSFLLGVESSNDAFSNGRVVASSQVLKQ